uniref:FAD-binding domain-containing protein n=1 Tax=Eutreptiella gymnastica TaxID=73025 RepID=A0A6U8H9I9_9EUGL
MLVNTGHSVEIYERLDRIEPHPETSYPIGVNPRGLNAIKQISPELQKQIKDHGTVVKAWEIYGGTRKVAELCSGTTYGTTRATVNHLLYTDAVDRGVVVNFSHQLKSIDFEARQLVFKDTSSRMDHVVDATHSKVIACDGAYSAVRQQLVAHDADFKASVQITPWGSVYRALFAHGDTAALDPLVHYIFNGLYVAKATATTWAFVPGALLADESHRFLLTDTATPDNVQRLKAFVAEKAPKALELIPEEEYERFWQRRAFPGQIVQCSQLQYKGWLVFLGDAAHSVHPSTGEGINSGLEDAAVLSRLVAEEGNSDALFGRYEQVRVQDLAALGRIARYLEQSSWDAQFRVSSTITTILVGIGGKLGLTGPSKEAYMFGTLIDEDHILSYSEIYSRWQHQIRYIKPFAERMAKWFGPKQGSPVPAFSTDRHG